MDRVEVDIDVASRTRGCRKTIPSRWDIEEVGCNAGEAGEECNRRVRCSTTNHEEGIVYLAEAQNANAVHLDEDNHASHTRIHFSCSWMDQNGHASNRYDRRAEDKADTVYGATARSRRWRATNPSHRGIEEDGEKVDEDNEEHSSCVPCSMTSR